MHVGFYSSDLSLHRSIAHQLAGKYNISLMPYLLPSDLPYEAVIVDLPSESADLHKRIESVYCMIDANIPVIVLADQSLQRVATQMDLDALSGCCDRPPSIAVLSEMLSKINPSPNTTVSTPFHSKEIARQHTHRNKLDQLVGSSMVMNHVYDLIHRVSNNNASVMVIGESGTGKELVARAIHNIGSRSKRPFVAVSCSAIPETLIESELFGYEKGAFTGATGQHIGYMEQAGDGTLFLDEIGDIPLFYQVKLLRILQQMEYRRLGGTQSLKLRARLIFATNRNLDEMVAAGTFRQDLYYRINVVRIRVPSLRDHAEDIPQIASHVLKKYSDLYQKGVMSFDSRAVQVLQNHAWTGNVRELENVIQHAIILSDSSIISAEHLQFNSGSTETVDNEILHSCDPFEKRIRAYKYKVATSAIQRNRGNKTQAARDLGISRAYLHRLLLLGDMDTPQSVEVTDEEPDSMCTHAYTRSGASKTLLCL